jgi:hypothetical protein
MNERIKELAIKAKLGSAEFDNGVRYYVSTEESFEKFAELIVRECADWVKSRTMSNELKEELKRHFGVK